MGISKLLANLLTPKRLEKLLQNIWKDLLSVNPKTWAWMLNKSKFAMSTSRLVRSRDSNMSLSLLESMLAGPAMKFMVFVRVILHIDLVPLLLHKFYLGKANNKLPIY